MPVLTFCLADSSYYKENSFSSSDLFLSPDESNPDNIKTFRIPSGSPSIKSIYEIYPQLPSNPDYVFIKTDALGRNFVQDLSSLNCPVVASLADTHHLHRPLEKLIKYAENQNFDLISIENDRHHAKWYSRFNVENLCWLPNLALHPFNYLPQPINKIRRKICFVGSTGRFHPYRNYVVSFMKQIYNNDFQCSSLSRMQASQAYNQFLISLNVSLNSDLNWRFFEVLAAGGFLLSDRLPNSSGVDLFLKEGIHYEAFGCMDELRSKVDYYLSNPQQALDIARNGYETYWNYLSPKILRKEMLKRIYGYSSNPLFDSPLHHEYEENIDNLSLLRIYQVCQEIHRLSISPIVVVRDDLLELIKKELTDFPRFTVMSAMNLSTISPGSHDNIVIVQDSTFEFNLIPQGFSKFVFCPLDFLLSSRYANEPQFSIPSLQSSFIYNDSIDAYVGIVKP